MNIREIQNHSYVKNVNSSKRQNFKARFDEASMSRLLKEANCVKATHPEIMPQLYTMLQHIDSFPGKVAKVVDDIKPDSNPSFLLKDLFCKIVIDDKKVLFNKHVGHVSGEGNIVGGSKTFAINLLKKLCIYNEKESNPTGYVRMPQSVFEQKWWENRHRTTNKDILKYQY